MMETYTALLRGINVGGNNVIKMEDLKKVFEKMNFTGIKTYIASGNVIFNSPEKDKTRLVQLIEKRLSERYKTDLRLVIVGFRDYRGIIENAPAGFGKESQIYRYDVWFLKEPLSAEEVLRQITPREGVDTICKGNGAIYTSRLISMMGKSHLIRVNKLPIYQNITVRSWNTTVKLFELISSQNP
jgi:uncharacterized protein (DUF1697 family)